MGLVVVCGFGCFRLFAVMFVVLLAIAVILCFFVCLLRLILWFIVWCRDCFRSFRFRLVWVRLFCQVLLCCVVGGLMVCGGLVVICV